MVRACACIVATLLTAGCGQRGPLVLPPALSQPAPSSALPARSVPALSPFSSDVPLSPSISDSPDPNAAGSPGDAATAPGDTRRPSAATVVPSNPAPVLTR